MDKKSLKIKLPLTISVGYGAVCSLYIWFSGEIAAMIATNQQMLRSIELYKGIGFIVVTSILLFIFSATLIKQMIKQQEKIELQRRSMIALEQRSMMNTFAASIVHDIKNILFSFKVLEFSKEDPEEFKKNFKSIKERINTGIGMLENLSLRLDRVSEKDSLKRFQKFDMSESIHKTVEFLRTHIKSKMQ
mgnify:CR=1 FL=1